MTQKFNELYNLKCNANDVAKLEQVIYYFAQKLSGGKYSGGFWKSEVIKDQENVYWYFKLNGDKRWDLHADNITSSTEISSNCLSVLSFTFALNYLMCQIHEDENSKELFDEIVRLYYGVIGKIDLILDENEKQIFYRTID